METLAPKSVDELARLKRCLHDTTLQVLELIAGGVSGGPTTLDEARVLAWRAADDLRDVLESHDQVEVESSLAVALDNAVMRERELAPYPLELVLGPVDEALDPESVGEIVAAASEALRNARKHADPSRVIVYCGQMGGETVVTVRDDGTGISDPALLDRGLGVSQCIRGRIAELGGVVEIESVPEGTIVTMRVPAQEAM